MIKIKISAYLRHLVMGLHCLVLLLILKKLLVLLLLLLSICLLTFCLVVHVHEV